MFSQGGWLPIVGNAGAGDNNVRIYISGAFSFLQVFEVATADLISLRI